MLKLIKESFHLTNKYIILATPLILFSLLSSLYILFSVGGSVISLLIAFVLFVMMLIAFLSGWFFMIKKSISTELDDEEANSLIKYFPEGVGEYFLPCSGLVILAMFFTTVMLILAYFVGMKLIGNIGISAEVLSKASESMGALKALLASLSEEQFIRLNAWNLLLLVTMAITYLVLMFYAPAMFFKEKNPLKAFWTSLKDLFSRKFFHNALLYLVLFISYFILSVFTTVFGFNVITHFVFTLINFYYLVLVAMLVFNFYYTNYVKIGGNIDKMI